MSTSDDQTTDDQRSGDAHLDVDAAQADADNEPVTDDQEPAAADEDRNP